MKNICFVLVTVAASSCALIQPAWPSEAIKERDLYSFCSQKQCADGALPLGGLIVVNDTIYGTTQAGGALGGGTVFALDPDTGTETVLHSFCQKWHCTADGSIPVAGLVDVNSTLYGTTESGGEHHFGGTLFSLDPATGAETLLHSFGGAADGANPFDLIDVKGSLYGTTQSGGAHSYGTVFSFDPSSGVEKVLYSFCNTQDCADGYGPMAGLVNERGTFYGTTYFGGGTGCNGTYGCGTVFSFDQRTGAETVLHAFSGGADGEYPSGDLMDLNGTLYGTTSQGGSYGLGTLFSLDTISGTESVLHSFGSGTDGSGPGGRLIDVNGTLYGTTATGGTRGGGTAFAFDPTTGTETVLYSFCSGTCDNGPHGGLTASRGTLYGTTYQGGAKSAGTVFELKKF